MQQDRRRPAETAGMHVTPWEVIRPYLQAGSLMLVASGQTLPRQALLPPGPGRQQRRPAAPAPPAGQRRPSDGAKSDGAKHRGGGPKHRGVLSPEIKPPMPANACGRARAAMRSRSAGGSARWRRVASSACCQSASARESFFLRPHLANGPARERVDETSTRSSSSRRWEPWVRMK